MNELITLRFVRWSSADPADDFVVADPATGAHLATIRGGGPAEIDGAVRAARKAFDEDWRRRPGRERGALLQAVARRLRTYADEIAALETSENGKPLPQARLDVEAAIASFDYFGGLAGKLPGDWWDAGVVQAASFLEPYGVVGAIIPFNWPPIHTAGKAAPALAAGNTIVIKAPEQTLLTVLRIVELAAAELPADVIQVVPGAGSTAGAALAAHPLVGKLSFTGATATGAAVVRAAAANTTPVFLELGGKNAAVVLDDADLALAAASIIEGAFYNKGEACTAISRVLVTPARHDELVARLAGAVRRLRVGAGTTPGVHVGPLVSAAQRDRVLAHVECAVGEGAVIAAQAALPGDSALAGGFFVAPTLLTGVERSMRVATEEVFGPVLAVLRVEDEEDAVATANATPYGLTAAVFTRDQPTAWRIARALDVGIVFQNNYFRGAGGLPFGGVKASGHGREHTIETLNEYGRVKLVSMPSGLAPVPRWQGVTDVGL